MASYFFCLYPLQNIIFMYYKNNQANNFIFVPIYRVKSVDNTINTGVQGHILLIAQIVNGQRSRTLSKIVYYLSLCNGRLMKILGNFISSLALYTLL